MTESTLPAIPAQASVPTPAATTPAFNDEPTKSQQLIVNASRTTVAPLPEPGATPVTPILSSETLQAAPHPPQPESEDTHVIPSTSGATPAPVATTKGITTTSEEPEPQNPLTQRFTQQEWTALKEFRAALPDMFIEAYEKPESREIPIVLWGVLIDPLHPNRDARISVILMKFLRARNLSVRDARNMFVSTLRWRVSFNVDAAMKEEFPQEIFGRLGHVYGKDKEGRPVVYNLYGANQDLKVVFGDVQRFLRWRVVLMETSTSFLDFTTVDQTLQVHDYEGVSLTSSDTNSKNAASEATSIFQSHYPELLFKKFFVNVPTFLNWIFWAMKPLISANTLAKMSVTGSGHHTIGKALLPHIDSSQLPRRYGGEADAF
ncbi:hypothetical protein AMATHDRAFT_58391 [Amanita thiersii Skay4041]|uniref:Phosphatidylinositol transfer protein SFH5 n=1 Tax=Amanita thiersii Skay4041 TaxID=703135 RepID=A0A2A9NMT5_9AGAR|nr:hypothetical protein AMATHDRAFT_58391 [Amanita thiersii Skay4041]